MNPNVGVQTGCCGAYYNQYVNPQPTLIGNSKKLGVVTPPYGITPVKYIPSGSSSVGRSPWDGWRYGAGYTGPNERMV
jgi:hypothetical protein